MAAISESGHLNPQDYSTAGAVILQLIILTVSNFTLTNINTYPFLLIPAIILCGIIFKIFHRENALFFLVFIPYLLPNISPSPYVLGSHDMGHTLFLFIVALLAIGYSRPINFRSISTLILIGILSISFVSYKLNFLVVCFLLFVGIITLINHSLFPLEKRVYAKNLILVSLAGSILTLYVSKFFYHRFIPYFSASELSDFGMLKVLDVYLKSEIVSPFSQYLFTIPEIMSSISLFRVSIIAIIFFLTTVYFVKKLYCKVPLSRIDIIYLGLFMSSFSLLILYNIMGTLEYSYFLFTGLLGFGLIIYEFQSIRKYLILCAVVLFGLSILSMAFTIQSDYYHGHKTYDENEYIDHPLQWLIKYLPEGTSTAADIFTQGYVDHKSQDKLLSPLKNALTPEDILFLFGEFGDYHVDDHKYFILNHQLEYLATDRWYKFMPLSAFKDKINENVYLNKVYSSELIAVLCP